VIEKQKDSAFDPAREMRLGGLVEIGSIHHLEDGGMRFTITDLTNTIAAEYHGLVPTLFREGQGVVATGHFEGESFMAREILTKHDEKYMPKEVADALKASGQWKPE
jgi:cytochrome c-type biogenesis protein CcmE